MGRQLRSRLNLVQPNIEEKVRAQQQKQQQNCKKSGNRSFTVGDSVYVSDLPTQDTWLPGVITKVFGSLTYEIELSDHRIVRWHIDHLKARKTNTPTVEEPNDRLPPPENTPPPEPTSTQENEPQACRRSVRESRRPNRYSNTIGQTNYTVDT